MGPNVLSGGAQLLNGPTQYSTLNSVLMSLEYNLYRSSCYFVCNCCVCFFFFSVLLFGMLVSLYRQLYRPIRARLLLEF